MELKQNNLKKYSTLKFDKNNQNIGLFIEEKQFDDEYIQKILSSFSLLNNKDGFNLTI